MRYVCTFGFHLHHILSNNKLIGWEEKITNVILIYGIEDECSEEERERVLNIKSKLHRELEKLEIPHTFIKVNPFDFIANIEKFKELLSVPSVVNLTGGKRIICYALFYAAIINKKNISKIFYVTKENEIIELPIISLDLKISPFERKILNLLEKKGKLYINQISKFLERSPSMISEYISKLESKGLIKKIYEGKKRKISKVI